MRELKGKELTPSEFYDRIANRYDEFFGGTSFIKEDGKLFNIIKRFTQGNVL